MKLGRGWQGPNRIVACPTDVNCQIQLLPERPPLMVHVDHLKPHLGKVPAAWQDVIADEVNSGPEVDDAVVAQPDSETELENETELQEDSDNSVSEPVLRRSRRCRKPLVRYQPA